MVPNRRRGQEQGSQLKVKGLDRLHVGSGAARDNVRMILINLTRHCLGPMTPPRSQYLSGSYARSILELYSINLTRY